MQEWAGFPQVGCGWEGIFYPQRQRDGLCLGNGERFKMTAVLERRWKISLRRQTGPGH